VLFHQHFPHAVTFLHCLAGELKLDPPSIRLLEALLHQSNSRFDAPHRLILPRCGEYMSYIGVGTYTWREEVVASWRYIRSVPGEARFTTAKELEEC
jgi:hypothetical protein